MGNKDIDIIYTKWEELLLLQNWYYYCSASIVIASHTTKWVGHSTMGPRPSGNSLQEARSYQKLWYGSCTGGLPSNSQSNYEIETLESRDLNLFLI